MVRHILRWIRLHLHWHPSLEAHHIRMTTAGWAETYKT